MAYNSAAKQGHYQTLSLRNILSQPPFLVSSQPSQIVAVPSCFARMSNGI